MSWTVYILTMVETNAVSAERIAEYTDRESEVRDCTVASRHVKTLEIGSVKYYGNCCLRIYIHVHVPEKIPKTIAGGLYSV
jgi:hypothetical protein